ncbi:MAG TPA: molybdate ABC transporter substrate-binding protein [Blastocatellia bacterium]|nr:molybdate ABC transporter substrate-binding protein [Blastocatellia bacterium]
MKIVLRLFRAALSLIAMLAFTALLALNCSPRKADLLVAAAADLTPAFEELGQKFEQQTGKKITFTFGSTGNLTKQIENGAPFDLFAAANIEYIEQLERQELIVPGTKQLYARGRITIWTRADSPIQIRSLEDLARSDVKRIAIANPEHAPYGVAAREALQSAGIWQSVESKIAPAENVRQALQYAETGNADAAIVALSLSVQSSGRWALVPEDLHRPLDQALAIIKDSKHEQLARQFADFINSPEGRAVMRKYGFILPGEQPPGTARWLTMNPLRD